MDWLSQHRANECWDGFGQPDTSGRRCPEGTRYVEVVGIRAREIPAPTNWNQKEREWLMRAKADVALDTSTFVITVSLKDSEGNVVSQDNVDLPLESVVVGGDEKDGIVTLTLQNGNTITFDIGDLVDGLASQAQHDEDIAALNARIDAALGTYVTDIDTLIGEGK